MSTLTNLVALAESGALSANEMGILADLFKDYETQRLALDKESAKVKELEVLAKETLIAQMLHQQVSAVGGSKFTATIKRKEKPHAKDWPAIWNYMRDNNDFSLVQKRLSEAAVAEHWEAGEEVPGVEKFPVYTLSMSKVTSGA